MRITHIYKETSNAAQTMMQDAITHAHHDIYDVYAQPSRAKVLSFEGIKNDYMHNDTKRNGISCKTVASPQGTLFLTYRGDIAVTGTSSHFYSTIATFNDVYRDGGVWVIKETYCNTYATWLKF